MLIKNAILSLAAASTFTHGAVQVAATAQASAEHQASIYAIAGQLMEGSFFGDTSAEARLYEAAGKLQASAGNVREITEADRANIVLGMI